MQKAGEPFLYVFCDAGNKIIIVMQAFENLPSNDNHECVAQRLPT